MGPGGFDMQQIFAAAQQAMSAQQELANSEVTGTAGGGAVRAVVSGVGQLLDVTIDPSVIDPADPAAGSAAPLADSTCPASDCPALAARLALRMPGPTKMKTTTKTMMRTTK